MSDDIKDLFGKITGQKDPLAAIGIKANSDSNSSKDIAIDRLTTIPTPERWNEVHTYYFAVAMADADGSVSSNWQPPPSTANFSRTIAPLSIPPSALSVGVQFASSVVATNRGILEENNGVVFRTISISGTTGMWSGRKSDKDPATPPSSTFNIASIFPGAVAAVQQLVQTAKGIFGGPDLKKKSNTLDIDQLKQTGYYQFWILNNFFLEYAENKKGLRKQISPKDASRMRLLFASPKDNITYVVTPVSFDLRKDASNPLQYKYNIQLRCWDITTATSKLSSPLDFIPTTDSITSIRDLAERLRRARRAINQAGNVIKAVQSDIFEALNVVNQAVLAVKDIVGLEQDLMDFAPTLKQNIDSMIANNKAQWGQVMQDNGVHGPLATTFLEGANSNNALLSGGSSASVGQVLGVSSSAASAKSLDSSTTVNTSPSGENSVTDLSDVAGNKVIGDFLNNPDQAEATPLSSLGTLSAGLASAIDDQITKSQEITANDISALADKLKQVSDNIAYSTGMMDPNYASIYGLPAPTPTDRTPNEDDIILAAQIEDGRDAFIGSLATGTIYGEREDDPFSAANQILRDDDTVPTPISAIPVFVQRGATLDDLAKTYLGDANRAREIAILNELRSPYIDEAGFSIPIFLAANRTFVVNSRDNLVISQIIRLSGTGVATSRRIILSIDDIGGGQFRITVDGQPNLEVFITASSPMLSARTPGTVGSGDTILIPTDNPNVDNRGQRNTPLLERLTHAERTFKVDMALTEDGDLAVGPDGDFSRSYGYQNAVQALRIAVETERGELEQHPDFGINASVGNTITGDVVTGIQESVQTAVVSDPRFQTADVTANIDGTALRIRVDAQGSNGTGLIPVEFKVNT